MKKRYVVGLLFLLVIGSFVFLVRNDGVVSFKTYMNKELSLNDIELSNLYEYYTDIELDSALDVVEKKIGRKGKLDDIGLFYSWEFSYGNLRAVVINDKIIHEQVTIYNLEKVDVDLEQLDRMNGTTTYDEVLDLLGPTLEFGKTLDPKIDAVTETYVWKLKSDKVISITFYEDTIFRIRKI